QDGRLSSSYSRCFQEKFNKCIPEDNKIDCGESWLKRTESDGYCRCDARRGFAPENENIDSMCFYTDAHCMLKKCPSAQELALNYSCIINCPDGYYRTDDSDACVERASATAKTKPPTTASSTTDQTYTQSTIDSTTGKVETSGEAVSTHTAGSQKETEVDNLSRVKLLSGVEQEGRKDKRHQNAALNNTPDEGEKNAATNDIPDEGDKNAVSVDNEMNNTLNARVEAHLSGRSIASSCNIASRSRTDETQF
ncbi:hypothetical protein MAR_015998, partial [Mya arenaria]